MAKKMQAAFVEHFGKPLVFMDVDVPTPGRGQVLVKTEACGVCHTDLHAATGDWPLKPKLPFTPGHEAIGRVAAVGGAHGVLITAPSLGAFKQGVGMTRKRGTCVLVGLPPGDFPVPLFDVVANCITIRGSFVGNREDMAEALAFAAEGKVKADIELEALSSINDIFDRLERSKVAGRVVLDFLGTKADDQKSKAPAAKKLEATVVA